MDINDLVLISVDDHVVEPPGMFKNHLPADQLAKAPRVQQMKNGGDSWVYEDMVIPNFGLNAVVGRPPEEFGFEPAAYDQIRAGCYDLKARLDDMNVNGVLAAICFPTFVHFAGAFFLGAKDKEFTKKVISAYNDWHVDEWCGGDGKGRFIPIGILPLWDLDACIAETKRLAKKGVHTISFPDSPHSKGLPSVHSGYWDPLFAVLSDNQMVISTHIGSGAQAPYSSMDSPIDTWIVTMPISIVTATTDWLFSSVFKRFPKLKIALSEGGIGWIPYFLERADFTFKHHKAWTNSGANFGDMLPSELFKRNFLTCFIDDKFGLDNLKYLNSDMVAWECDYPHSDSVWPRSPEVLWDSVKNLPKEIIDKCTHLNAMREYSFDPFSILGGRDKCTVGALRAKAGHVNTTPVAGMGGHNPSNREGRPVTSGEVIKLFTAA